MGIRKVLGSTTTTLTTLLTKEYLILVLIANLIAWPLSWYFVADWLQNFAYRIQINPLTFLLAGVIAFSIAIITISTKAIRTAMTNPAEVLRYE